MYKLLNFLFCGVGVKLQLFKWKDSSRDKSKLLEALNLIISIDRKIMDISLDLNGVLNEILAGFRKVSNSHDCQILLRRGNKLFIAHSTEKSAFEEEFDIQDCLAGKVLETRGVFYSGNVLLDYPDRYKWRLGKENSTQMLSQLSVPIFSPTTDKVILGILNSESPDLNAYNKEDRQIASQFALQAGVAINNLHFQEGVKLTMSIVDAFQSSHRLQIDAVRDALVRLSNFFGNEIVVQLLSVDIKKSSLLVWCSTIPSTENTSVLIKNSFCGLVYNKNRTLRSNDVEKEHPNQFKDTVGNSGQKPTKSEMASPIKKSGIIIGILNIESSSSFAFTEHDENFLKMIALQAEAWMPIHSQQNLNAITAMKTIGDAAANIIHVVRNTSASLSYPLSELKKISEDTYPSVFQYVDRINRSITGLGNRIDDLEKNYVRGQNEPEKTFINSLMINVVTEVISRAEIDIIYELDNSLEEVYISPGFKDVVWNLLSNAQKAIKEKKTGTITVGSKMHIGEYTKEKEGFSVWVKDDGVGISKENLENILDPRFSSNEKGGFGLFWVNTFVERWGGKITIESTLNEGANFKITFPYSPISQVLE